MSRTSPKNDGCVDLVDIPRTVVFKIDEVLSQTPCKEDGCRGKAGVLWPVSFKVDSGGSWTLGYPCDECGRLYQIDRQLINYVDGRRAFVEDGKGVLRNESGEVSGEFEIIVVGS